MAAQRANIHLNLGPNAPFDVVSAAFSDIRVVIDVAQRVQEVLDRNDATYIVLRRRDNGEFIDDLEYGRRFFPSERFLAIYGEGPPFATSPTFQRAVAEQLELRQNDSLIRVSGFTYANPLDLHINFDGGAIARILEVIRDWRPAREQAGARARQANAEAREAEARADRYEEKLRVERAINDQLIRALTTEHLRLGREQVVAVLGDQAARSISTLLAAEVVIEIEDDDITEPPQV